MRLRTDRKLAALVLALTSCTLIAQPALAGPKSGRGGGGKGSAVAQQIRAVKEARDVQLDALKEQKKAVVSGFDDALAGAEAARAEQMAALDEQEAALEAACAAEDADQVQCDADRAALEDARIAVEETYLAAVEALEASFQSAMATIRSVRMQVMREFQAAMKALHRGRRG